MDHSAGEPPTVAGRPKESWGREVILNGVLQESRSEEEMKKMQAAMRSKPEEVIPFITGIKRKFPRLLQPPQL